MNNTTNINKLLDIACSAAGSRNKLTGILDITTSQFESFRRKGEVSLPCAVKLEQMTGITWKRFAPEYADVVEKLPVLVKG